MPHLTGAGRPVDAAGRLVRRAGRAALPENCFESRSHLPDLRGQGIEVGVLAGLFFAVNQLAIDDDFKDTA